MSTNAVIAFDFEEQPLRTIERQGEPWFVLSDVCRILAHTNPRMVAERLDDDEKGVSLTYTPGGQQEVIIVNEAGLYSVILRSRGATNKDTPAWRFRRWVTHDVLPSIRKHGFYGERHTVKAVQARNAMQNQAMRIVGKLKVTRHVAERRMLWDMLNSACNELGIATPLLEDLGKDQPGTPDILSRFWSLYHDLEADGLPVNWHRKEGMVALNLPDLRQLFQDKAITFKFDRDFYAALKQSTDPRFVRQGNVNSRDGKTRQCWIFERPEVQG